MSAVEKRASKKSGHKATSDVYTCLLGLAVLVLAGTIGFVCYRGQELFGSIFKITGP